MLSAIGARLAPLEASLLLGFVAKLISDAATRAQADRNAKAVGQLATTAAVNKETADTERRGSDAAIKAPDLRRVLDDLDRGKL